MPGDGRDLFPRDRAGCFPRRGRFVAVPNGQPWTGSAGVGLALDVPFPGDELLEWLPSLRPNCRRSEATIARFATSAPHTHDTPHHSHAFAATRRKPEATFPSNRRPVRSIALGVNNTNSPVGLLRDNNVNCWQRTSVHQGTGIVLVLS